jgi:hypothetical protein
MQIFSKVLAMSGAGLTSLLLVSCGSGSDSGNGSGNSNSNSISRLNADANQAYTGSRDPALLNKSNTPLFSSLIIGHSANTETLYRVEESSPSILLNQSKLINGLLKVTQTGSSHTDLNNRAVLSCDNGGTVSADGDTETDVGSVIYTFVNCQINNDATLNGQASETVGTDGTKTVAYEALTVFQNDQSFSVTGAVIDDGMKVVSNLTSAHTASGLSTYLQDYTTTFEDTYISPPISISGKAFISNEGYVTVSTSEDYSSYSDHGIYIPSNGEIFMTGAALSTARVVGTGDKDDELYGYTGDSKYTVGLDIDGDGAYELTSIQDLSTADTVELEENTPPTAIITATHYNSLDGYSEHNSDDNYLINMMLHLDSGDSYDHNDTELLRVWTIEEKPEASTATIVEQGPYSYDIFRYNYRDYDFHFSPDVRGSYKISLKVTDHLGSQQSSISFITVNVANFLPTIIHGNSDYYEEYVVGVRPTNSINIWNTDRDTFSEDPGVLLSYEWIEKPNNSAPDLSTVGQYLSVDEESGFFQDIWYSPSFDTPGSYKLQFTAIDSDGAIGEQVIEMYVRSSSLTSDDIQCDGFCNWKNRTSTVNEVAQFWRNNRNFGNCNWRFVSIAPDQSLAPEVFEKFNSEYFDATPTQAGEYELTVTCFSSYNSEPTQFTTSLSITE